MAESFVPTTHLGGDGTGYETKATTGPSKVRFERWNEIEQRRDFQDRRALRRKF